MEIFERMGWYGFYAVSTLYLTNSVADGGLGFSSADRGVIQGLATFFLYLFPAVFGALADHAPSGAFSAFMSWLPWATECSNQW
jgi:dipeptide/tripeptide permease